MSWRTTKQWRYYQKNRAKVLACRKQYRDARKSELSQKWKQWAERNKTHLRMKGIRRRKQNPTKHRDMTREAHKKGRAELSDWYIKHQILRTKCDLPSDLIEAKRAQMKVRRLCRNLQTSKN